MEATKYTAIKIKGLDHWLWFDINKVTVKQNRFIGLAGWGKDGNYTEIDIDTNEIVGRIMSDTLQY